MNDDDRAVTVPNSVLHIEENQPIRTQTLEKVDAHHEESFPETLTFCSNCGGGTNKAPHYSKIISFSNAVDMFCSGTEQQN